MMNIQNFVQRLSHVLDNDEIANPYCNSDIAKNLYIYLSIMQQMEPLCLLVGEAPGQWGCAYTGIPFTDEYALSIAGEKAFLPLQNDDYQTISEKPHHEKSATIVWNALAQNQFYPLMWNAFPFHPHQRGSLKNRTPSSAEMKMYPEYIPDIMQMFSSINKVYVVGYKAQGA